MPALIGLIMSSPSENGGTYILVYGTVCASQKQTNTIFILLKITVCFNYGRLFSAVSNMYALTGRIKLQATLI